MKCSKCKCNRNIEDFTILKNGKTKKTCNKCIKKNIDEIADGFADLRIADGFAEKGEVSDVMTFIRHQRKYNKLLTEFKDRASQPVHVYNTKNLFVDIRDRWNPHEDKDNSFCNSIWFSTFVI